MTRCGWWSDHSVRRFTDDDLARLGSPAKVLFVGGLAAPGHWRIEKHRDNLMID